MELVINEAELCCKPFQKDCQVCGSWFKNRCAIGVTRAPNASSTPLPSSEEHVQTTRKISTHLQWKK